MPKPPPLHPSQFLNKTIRFRSERSFTIISFTLKNDGVICFNTDSGSRHFHKTKLEEFVVVNDGPVAQPGVTARVPPSPYSEKKPPKSVTPVEPATITKPQPKADSPLPEVMKQNNNANEAPVSETLLEQHIEPITTPAPAIGSKLFVSMAATIEPEGSAEQRWIEQCFVLADTPENRAAIRRVAIALIEI